MFHLWHRCHPDQSSQQSTPKSTGMPCDTFQPCSVQHEKLVVFSKQIAHVTNIHNPLLRYHGSLPCLGGTGNHRGGHSQDRVPDHVSIALPHDGIYNGCEHTLSTRVVVHIPDSTGGDVHIISHAENNRPWPITEATSVPSAQVMRVVSVSRKFPRKSKRQMSVTNQPPPPLSPSQGSTRWDDSRSNAYRHDDLSGHQNH